MQFTITQTMVDEFDWRAPRSPFLPRTPAMLSKRTGFERQLRSCPDYRGQGFNWFDGLDTPDGIAIFANAINADCKRSNRWDLKTELVLWLAENHPLSFHDPTIHMRSGGVFYVRLGFSKDYPMYVSFHTKGIPAARFPRQGNLVWTDYFMQAEAPYCLWMFEEIWHDESKLDDFLDWHERRRTARGGDAQGC